MRLAAHARQPRVVALRGTAPLARAHAIRRAVFVGEQGVAEREEIDRRDRPCRHYLARRGTVEVGTARLRPLGRGTAKIERMAVLAAHRRAGVGRALIAAIERDARRAGLARLVLHAQAHAVPFYERLGYAAEGPGFAEAGIPHRFMRKNVR